MGFRIPSWATCVFCLLAASAADAATIAVPAGGDLQAALDAAQPGDVITLEPNATYTGNFILPNKALPDNGDAPAYITIRSAAPDSVFPPNGVRITPAYAAHLPKIKSSNALWALQTATRAHHYKLMFLEFQANVGGANDIITIGANDSTQTELSQVPYAFILDRLYVHGDPQMGQKRGIALHSGDTTVVNSWVSDCKSVTQDSQAIGGFNGPGPYVIENNYLEGAGENFLLGGSDPPIQNLVTTGVTFRYNHLSKPFAWLNQIIATPVDVIAVATRAAGSLDPGTYSYKVVARTAAGGTTVAISIPSAEVSATLDTAGAVTIAWTPVVGAQDYAVYGRTSSSQNIFWTTKSPYFTDTGGAGTLGAVPKGNTKWSVKNTFELKNARDVMIEGNVFENLWVAAQPGYPIVLTPRNQNGKAPWVVVEGVMFRNNIVRHTAGGVNILSTDNLAPSQLTNHITITNNLFDDLTASRWGAARVFLIGGDAAFVSDPPTGADRVTIDHNTIVTTQSAIYYLLGRTVAPTRVTRPLTNLTITNNMSLHNSVGLFGDRLSIGAAALPYFPDGTFCGNILAGGTAKQYPSTPKPAGFACSNFLPTVAEWPSIFTNYAAGDYRLLPASKYKNAGTDGKDLGADMDVVVAETAIALSGDSRRRSADPEVRIITTGLPNAKYRVPYNERVLCTPGIGPCAWAVQDSSLPAGLVFDPASGVISGTPSEAATGLLTLLAYDTVSPLTGTIATLTITVDPPDFVVSVPAIPAGKVGEPFHVALTVGGALGNVSWSVVSGQFPDGVNLDALSGEIAGTPSTWGTTTALVEAQDAWGIFRTAARTVTITIVPASVQISTSVLPGGVYHSRYEATLSATGGTGSYSWSVASGELPGLLVDTSGLVTGEPQCIGSFSLNLEATDTKWPGYTSSGTVSLEIVPTPFSVSIPAAPVGVVGSPYSLMASTSGQVGTVTWSVASGQLPAGLTIDATGTISGVATAFGVFTAIVQAHDSYSTCGTPEVTRTAEQSVLIAIAPLPIAITTATLPSGTVPMPYRAALEFAGGTGSTTWSLVDGQLPKGLELSPGGIISGRPKAVGTFPFTVQASDAGWAENFARRTFSVTIRAREVVIYASDANIVKGTWSLAPDATAADGSRLWNPNKSAGKIDEPLANPANYFEVPFQAEAGVAYHLWLRGKADRNKRVNDAVMVQFSGSVDEVGTPDYRIGTTSATDVNLADCNGCHLSGWGWQDNGWGVNVMGPAIYFEQSGAQTIRVQVKQDGFSIDQIVLSAEKFLTVAPAGLKNDRTLVLRDGSQCTMRLGTEADVKSDEFDPSRFAQCP